MPRPAAVVENDRLSHAITLHRRLRDAVKVARTAIANGLPTDVDGLTSVEGEGWSLNESILEAEALTQRDVRQMCDDLLSAEMLYSRIMGGVSQGIFAMLGLADDGIPSMAIKIEFLRCRR